MMIAKLSNKFMKNEPELQNKFNSFTKEKQLQMFLL